MQLLKSRPAATGLGGDRSTQQGSCERGNGRRVQSFCRNCSGKGGFHTINGQRTLLHRQGARRDGVWSVVIANSGFHLNAMVVDPGQNCCGKIRGPSGGGKGCKEGDGTRTLKWRRTSLF